MSLDVVLAHALPVEPGEPGHPFLVVSLLTLGVYASYGIGIAVANRLGASERRRAWATAASFGALLFLLFDLLKESASLGQGLTRNVPLMLSIVAAFSAGALFIPRLAGKEPQSSRLAWLWTLGIAAHGAGEGYVIGTEVTTTSLTAVFGIASFLIHKGIEGATVPFVAGALIPEKLLWRLAAASAGIGLATTLLGFWLGSSTLPVLFFAAGAGASAYAVLRLGSQASPTLRAAVGVLSGVLLVWAAGLLHEL